MDGERPEAGGEAGTEAGGETRAEAGGEAQLRVSLAEQARLLAEERARRARWQAATGAAFALVFVVVAAIAVVHFTSGGDDPRTAAPAPTTSAPTAAAPGAADPDRAADIRAAAVRAATTVPAAVLDQVGRGQADNRPLRVSGQPALTEGGKPLILYVGAEYCPYCASQRWAVVVALSRFGAFSGLGTTHLSSDDTDPDSQILTMRGATYTSEYVAFQGVEIYSNVRAGDGHAPLDKLTTEQERVFATLNAPPYVPDGSAGAIPFMDFGNKYVISGSAYDAQLVYGKPLAMVAAALSRPDDPIAQGIHGAANLFTALICQLTGGKPAQVCGSPAVKAYDKAF